MRVLACDWIHEDGLAMLREAGYDDAAITAMVAAGIAVDGRLGKK